MGARRWLALALGCLLIPGSEALPHAGQVARTAEEAIVLLLARRRIAAAPGDVHFLSNCQSKLSCYWKGRGVIALAKRRQRPSDVFLLHARASLEERHVLGLSLAYNATHTDLAEETQLVVSAPFAAWTIQDAERAHVFLVDTRGEVDPATEAWTGLQRVQNALTNFQETGQLRGIGRRSFELSDAIGLRLSFTDDALVVTTETGVGRVPLDPARPLEGTGLKETTSPKARPGNLVTWAVDRVRAISWIGDDRIAWVKAVANRADDGLNQLKSEVLRDEGKGALEDALGSLEDVRPLAQDAVNTGWPPAPLQTLFKTPLPNEGKWASLEHDPFVGGVEGHKPFATTFLRVDPKRPYSQVFITLWDPRWVGLHMVSGTVEPRSATGEVGTGLLPREPEILERVVAAFNGAFQAMHGEFGMMADDIVYLPPKPYAATVVELRDGATAFGTWPDSNVIPHDHRSFRQNLSPLIIDGQVNPYRRHWWGGMPAGWTEETRTVRSALCLTKDNFIAYFYGNSADIEQLGRALQLTNCVYGMQLDMNSGHCGFEFYRVARSGSLPPLPEALAPSWQAQGAVPDVSGFEFRARLMTKSTTLMNFPRYINRSSRDFFYLTLRPVPLPLEEAARRVFSSTPILPPTRWAFAQQRPAAPAVREASPAEPDETAEDTPKQPSGAR